MVAAEGLGEACCAEAAWLPPGELAAPLPPASLALGCCCMALDPLLPPASLLPRLPMLLGGRSVSFMEDVTSPGGRESDPPDLPAGEPGGRAAAGPGCTRSRCTGMLGPHASQPSRDRGSGEGGGLLHAFRAGRVPPGAGCRCSCRNIRGIS